jgi:hypothetical protein
VVKEWSQAAHHSLPFQCIPKPLMIHIVLNAVKMLNFFPKKGRNFQHSQPKDHYVWRDSRLQETLQSPSWTILSGAMEDTPRNSQSPRTKGAISLGPSGNLKAGYKFMALNTGRKLLAKAGM